MHGVKCLPVLQSIRTTPLNMEGVCHQPKYRIYREPLLHKDTELLSMLLDKLMGTKIESAVITKICPGYSLDDQVKMSKACSIYVIVNANMTITSSVYELWRREPNQRRGTSSPVSSGHGRVPLPVCGSLCSHCASCPPISDTLL